LLDLEADAVQRLGDVALVAIVFLDVDGFEDRWDVCLLRWTTVELSPNVLQGKETFGDGYNDTP
jgi:hypothetical protein